MKRLNSYLLTHHPLLWNLRVHIIWPVIIVLHLFFFCWGYGAANFPGIERYQRIHPGGEIITFSVLLSLLAGVWWLLLYFRNNAFKSFYPLRRGRLIAELLLIFATAFGLVNVSLAYSIGKVLHLRQMTSTVMLPEEQRVLATAEPFLPFQLTNYSRFNSCEHSDNQASITNDSGRLPTDTFSYLHYCEGAYREYSDGNIPQKLQRDSIHATAKRWLLQGRRDSVLLALQQYLKLVKKYGGDYHFNPEMHVTSMFETPGMELRYTIQQYRNYSGNGPDETGLYPEDAGASPKQAPNLLYGTRYAYIEARYPDEALSLIAQVRREFPDIFINIIALYTALVITILVLSFRITATRPWFIALIGAGLWMVAIGLLAAVIRGGSGSLLMVIVLELGFTVMAIVAQRTGWARRWAGVLLLWSLFGISMLLPAIWTFLSEVTYPETTYSNGIPVYTPPSAFHEFLSDHQSWASFGNVFLVLFLIAVLYIPLARSWQAMPEE